GTTSWAGTPAVTRSTRSGEVPWSPERAIAVARTAGQTAFLGGGDTAPVWRPRSRPGARGIRCRSGVLWTLFRRERERSLASLAWPGSSAPEVPIRKRLLDQGLSRR